MCRHRIQHQVKSAGQQIYQRDIVHGLAANGAELEPHFDFVADFHGFHRVAFGIDVLTQDFKTVLDFFFRQVAVEAGLLGHVVRWKIRLVGELQFGRVHREARARDQPRRHCHRTRGVVAQYFAYRQRARRQFFRRAGKGIERQYRAARRIGVVATAGDMFHHAVERLRFEVRQAFREMPRQQIQQLCVTRQCIRVHIGHGRHRSESRARD